MGNSSNTVRVGVASWIINPSGQILMGHRLGVHGGGMWGAPGGHLEFGETPIQTAIRETMEETAIDLSHDDVVAVAWTNDIFQDSKKHYITIHCLTYIKNDVVPKLCEPNKCAEWRWFNRNELPRDLFLPAKHFFEEYQFLR
ncbi:MAG: NUDIX domain-containing protein [Alphaproteobacteria bacterium]|nr:NUDIX domain-containing protein [Alphaproteobacteria bacterium]